MIMVESAPTALRRSGRANRAMYMLFINTVHAILLSVPVQLGAVPAFAADTSVGPIGVTTFVVDTPLLAFVGSTSMMANGSLD